MTLDHSFCGFFFFNDTATTEIYTLSLHDALPILNGIGASPHFSRCFIECCGGLTSDRKSTRLNSSHLGISYAVFCLEPTYELQSLRHLVCRLLLAQNVLTAISHT